MGVKRWYESIHRHSSDSLAPTHQQQPPTKVSPVVPAPATLYSQPNTEHQMHIEPSSKKARSMGIKASVKSLIKSVKRILPVSSSQRGKQASPSQATFASLAVDSCPQGCSQIEKTAAMREGEDFLSRLGGRWRPEDLQGRIVYLYKVVDDSFERAYKESLRKFRLGLPIDCTPSAAIEDYLGEVRNLQDMLQDYYAMNGLALEQPEDLRRAVTCYPATQVDCGLKTCILAQDEISDIFNLPRSNSNLEMLPMPVTSLAQSIEEVPNLDEPTEMSHPSSQSYFSGPTQFSSMEQVRRNRVILPNDPFSSIASLPKDQNQPSGQDHWNPLNRPTLNDNEDDNECIFINPAELYGIQQQSSSHETLTVRTQSSQSRQSLGDAQQSLTVRGMLGKYRDVVEEASLLSPSDSYGTMLKSLNSSRELGRSTSNEIVREECTERDTLAETRPSIRTIIKMFETGAVNLSDTRSVDINPIKVAQAKNFSTSLSTHSNITQ